MPRPPTKHPPFVRPQKGGQYQARPIYRGVRFDLGRFPTAHDAGRAVREFLANPSIDKVKPRHVVCHWTAVPGNPCVPKYHARIRRGGTLHRLGVYDDPHAAAQAVADFLAVDVVLLYGTRCHPSQRRRDPVRVT